MLTVSDSGGAPTMNQSWSASVSLNTCRTHPGSHITKDMGSSVTSSPSMRMRPVPSSSR